MLRSQDKRLFLGGRLRDVLGNHVPESLVSFGIGGSAGTGVTAGGSANTKGSYSELDASTDIDADGFYLNILLSFGADFLIDIAIGAPGSEVDVISNLQVSSVAATTIVQEVIDIYIPLRVPAGTRLSARCQATTGSKTCFISGQLARGGRFRELGLSRATTYGANTADSGGTSVDPGATISTKGAYSQLSAAITNPIKYALVCIGNQANAARTDSNFLSDIAIGGAGSESIVIPDLYFRPSSATSTLRPHNFQRFVSPIAAGTRLAARGLCGINDATDRLFDVVVIGFD